MKQNNVTTATVNPITNLADTKVLDQLRMEIDAALKQIAEKYDLDSIKLGKIKYSEGEFNSTVTAKVKAEHNPQVAMQNTYLSEIIGYSKNIVGLNFFHDGKIFKVAAINMKKPKYPIECYDPTGKMCGFTNNARLPFLDKTVEWKRPVIHF